MDAVTLVAAAVAIAVDQSRNAALEDSLQERERQAMRTADLESMVAQRMFTSNMQLPHGPPETWRTAHTDLRGVVNRAWNAMRQGFDETAYDVLEAEQMRVEQMRAEQEEQEEQMRAEQMRAEQWRRAELEEQQMRAELEEQWRAGAVEQILRRCAGCGRWSFRVTLQWPAGRWTDLPAEDRMLCADCEAADM